LCTSSVAFRVWCRLLINLINRLASSLQLTSRVAAARWYKLTWSYCVYTKIGVIFRDWIK